MSNSIKETILSVNGVQGCKILEENGEITQIFVEAIFTSISDDAKTQEIKGIVRSIIGAISIHHNIELDYRKIKVIDYKPDIGQDIEVHPRIQIVAAYRKRFPKSQCVVELHCLRKDYIGTVPLEEDLGLSTFKAFLNAFQQMGFGTIKLVYLQVLNNSLAQEKVILVKLEYRSDEESDILMGVAEAREDLSLAVVKATLNAVNRKIVFLSS